jgi:GT2 family glycosyltransferase
MFMLNSDVSVTPGWIEPVISIMESDQNIAACQPKILSYHQPALFEYAGAAGGWIDSAWVILFRAEGSLMFVKPNGQYNDAEPIFWASGAAMFVRANVYHELGGLDASFFAHQEEIDLCWRMQLAGYRIMSCPASVVYHVGAGTLPRGGRKVFLNFRNNLVMLCKNLPWQEKLWKCRCAGAGCHLGLERLLSGDQDFFIAIYKAHIAVIKHLGGPVKKAHPLKPLCKLEGVYHGSVVWQYFVKGHTRFREIIQKKAL